MGMAVGVQQARTLGVLAEWLGAVCPPEASRTPVVSLCGDSRQAGPGSVFFAVPGHVVDGARFAAAAVEAGAIAVVTEGPLDAEELPRPVPVLRVPRVRRAKGEAAHAFHGHPSRRIPCVGITGTNGKTTTASILHRLLETDGWRPALLSTIEERAPGGESRPASHTTPDALHLAQVLARTVAQGGQAAVLEVSSHALTQERTAGMRFQAGIFTQLSREHLDYHRSVEEYRDAKGKLFRDLDRHAVAILNAEDPCSLRYLGETRAKAWTYGLTPAADIRATVRRLDIDGMAFDVHAPGHRFDVSTRLMGRHNLMNALAATAAALALEVSPRAIQEGFETLRSVTGRLEPVDRGQDFRVLIDYAHTDDALEKVLLLLRPLTRGRILTVFGCGGDRDRDKRPRMGRVVARHSDHSWITSDNPRGEDPAAIAAEVLAGMRGAGPAQVVLDRREAIQAALHEARGGDIVLIAGKGHEKVQIVGEDRRPFDDRAVAEEVLWQLSN